MVIAQMKCKFSKLHALILLKLDLAFSRQRYPGVLHRIWTVVRDRIRI